MQGPMIRRRTNGKSEVWLYKARPQGQRSRVAIPIGRQPRTTPVSRQDWFRLDHASRQPGLPRLKMEIRLFRFKCFRSLFALQP